VKFPIEDGLFSGAKLSVSGSLHLFVKRGLATGVLDFFPRASLQLVQLAVVCSQCTMTNISCCLLRRLRRSTRTNDDDDDDGGDGDGFFGDCYYDHANGDDGDVDADDADHGEDT